VIICVGLAAVAAVWRFPQAVASLERRADENASLSYADREFAGGNGIVIDQKALYQARARIPETEAYRVEVGPRLRTSTPLTEPYIVPYAFYFLLPRLQSNDANWLLCYGCDLSRYGETARILWRHDAGISIARLDR
jgi:hypothetical protein